MWVIWVGCRWFWLVVDCSIFVVDGFGLVADCSGLVVDGLGLLKMVQAWLLMVWVGCRLFGFGC
jgi:hypothetical protein